MESESVARPAECFSSPVAQAYVAFPFHTHRLVLYPNQRPPCTIVECYMASSSDLSPSLLLPLLLLPSSKTAIASSMSRRRRCSRSLSSFVFSTATPRAHPAVAGIFSLAAAPSNDSRRSSHRRRSCKPSASTSAAGLPGETRDLLRPPLSSLLGAEPMPAFLSSQDSLRPCEAKASSV